MHTRDLQTDTPYNTYTRDGLPPTPIALPGRESLMAAVQPEDTGALYFVATGAGDGAHHFSRTLEEHNAGGAGLPGAPAGSGSRRGAQGAAAVSRGRFITLEGIEGAGK